MSEAFIGELRIMAFNFAPKGWAQCNGQLLAINTNQALFSLLGTTYGGNGTTTFALPNLQGRVPLGVGQGDGLPAYNWGQIGGTEFHSLSTNEMPQHLHTLSANASNAAVNNTSAAAAGSSLGQTGGFPGSGANYPVSLYSAATTGTALATGMIGGVGSGQAHENRQPFSVVNICIAIVGIFPSRN
ncbi:MAG: tail fiber protein [Pseudomonadota bacterium]